jgi:hypothetical protein
METTVIEINPNTQGATVMVEAAKPAKAGRKPRAPKPRTSRVKGTNPPKARKKKLKGVWETKTKIYPWWNHPLTKLPVRGYREIQKNFGN